MGLFSNLDNEGYDRQYGDKELLQRSLVFFRPYRVAITAIVVILLVLSILGAISPMVLAWG